MIGQLPDGSDLFLDHAVKKGGPFSELHPYLVVANSDPKAQKQFPLKFAIGRVVPSPSGKYLAYVEDRNPWEIIEDALEEYVVRHYGKDYRRK